MSLIKRDGQTVFQFRLFNMESFFLSGKIQSREISDQRERYYLHPDLYIEFRKINESFWYVMCECCGKDTITIQETMRNILDGHMIGDLDDNHCYRQYSPSHGLFPCKGNDDVTHWLTSRGLNPIMKPIQDYLEKDIDIQTLYDITVGDIEQLLHLHEDLSEYFCAMYSFLREWWSHVRFSQHELKQQLKTKDYEHWTHGEICVAKYFYKLSEQQKRDLSFQSQIHFKILEYTNDFKYGKDD